jgi:hypothetical protein
MVQLTMSGVAGPLREMDLTKVAAKFELDRRELSTRRGPIAGGVALLLRAAGSPIEDRELFVARFTPLKVEVKDGVLKSNDLAHGGRADDWLVGPRDPAAGEAHHGVAHRPVGGHSRRHDLTDPEARRPGECEVAVRDSGLRPAGGDPDEGELHEVERVAVASGGGEQAGGANGADCGAAL